MAVDNKTQLLSTEVPEKKNIMVWFTYIYTVGIDIEVFLSDFVHTVH